MYSRPALCHGLERACDAARAGRTILSAVNAQIADDEPLVALTLCHFLERADRGADDSRLAKAG